MIGQSRSVIVKLGRSVRFVRNVNVMDVVCMVQLVVDTCRRESVPS